MVPCLSTPRLLLRPVENTDAPFLEEHWNDPEVRRHLWDDEPVARGTIETVVRNSHDAFTTTGYGLWTVCAAEESRPLGVCGLRAVEGTAHVELLYSLHPRRRGRGLATEAARAVLRHGFSSGGLDRIVGGVDEPNVASRRVLERLGMRFLEKLSVGGRLVPYYAVTRDEFAASQDP